jgi:hypothetical protein
MELNFRKLEADEIECRINQISEKGLTLLLYKDARCDMNILDETVGPMNWSRRHTRDNANCVVSIYDEDKNEWVTKEDTGTESNTEKEKGLASDSFKRACVNWGIGRELYTAPFIYISKTDKDGKPNYNSYKNKSNKDASNDKFIVEAIRYDDKRNIIALCIKNGTLNKRVYVWQQPKKTENSKKEGNNENNK